MMHFKMSSSDKLKLPEIRFLTPQENQQLTDLAKDNARQMLGPDWKEKAKEAVDLWLERSDLASKPSAPLFPSFGKNRETLNWRRLDRRSVLKLVEKRAKASGILKRVCCHSFRATGVTEYMNSGGTIEIAQRIAGHTSPSTTRIYDRSGDQLTLEEIERVQIGKKQAI